MHHLVAVLPTSMEDLVQALMAKLRLPSDCGLEAPFLAGLHARLEAALRARRAQWQPHLELGRAPSWFLWQCLPLAALLHDTAVLEEGGPSTKRARTEAPSAGGSLPSFSREEVRGLLLASLSE